MASNDRRSSTQCDRSQMPMYSRATIPRCAIRRLVGGVAVLGLAVGSVAVASPAQSATNDIEVTSTDDSGPGTLRAALADAQATPVDDRISFAPSVTGTIGLTSGVLHAEVGDGSGSLTIEGPGRDVLAIDGGGQSGVLEVHGPGVDTRPTFVFSGLKLTGGSADEGGGALRATGADVTLDQMLLSSNRCGFLCAGGAVHAEGGSLLVRGTSVTGNTASQLSGGNGVGGGIYFDGGEAADAALTIADSLVSENTASTSGGGIAAQGPAPVTVADSTISGNTASSTMHISEGVLEYGEGGGIWADDLIVVDSRIIDNEALVAGGGLYGRHVTVTGSTVAHNASRGNGGGIRIDGVHSSAALRVGSSTITGNRARYGGGLSLAGDLPAELALSTVAANIAFGGGGLYAEGDVALPGTVLATNAGGDLEGDGVFTLSRSLVQDPADAGYVDDGGSLIGADPLLGPLGDHGGSTETVLPASNSPVIDQGDAFGATTDQRGAIRPVDAPDVPDSTDGSDIGPVELSPAGLAGPSQVANVSKPTITGRARVGSTLHTGGGTWEPQDVTLSYQWLRNGVPIAGATSSSYTLTPEDFGTNMYGWDARRRLAVKVTAAAEGGRDGWRVSDFTDYVGKGALTSDRRPRVLGRPRVGQVLRARPHARAVSPRPTHVSIQWFLGHHRLRWANGHRRFALKPRMRHERVRVKFVYLAPQGYHRMNRFVVKRHRVR